MKKLLMWIVPVVICACILLAAVHASAVQKPEATSPISVEIPSDGDSEELRIAYEELCDFMVTHGIPSEIGWEEFQNNYESGDYSSVEAYAQTFYDVLNVSAS